MESGSSATRWRVERVRDEAPQRLRLQPRAARAENALVLLVLGWFLLSEWLGPAHDLWRGVPGRLARGAMAGL